MSWEQPPAFELPNTAYGYGGQNGRVNLAAPPSAGGPAPAAQFAYRTTVGADNERDLMRGNWESNPLSKAFFSPGNIRILQNAIRRQVYERSQEKQWMIDDQSVDELQMIMRGLFLQYAKNLPYDITGQVAQLNTSVVEWTVPRIMSEVSMYKTYLNDISHMPVPMALPVSLSSAGTRSLPYHPFI